LKKQEEEEERRIGGKTKGEKCLSKLEKKRERQGYMRWIEMMLQKAECISADVCFGNNNKRV
jgi:hypothetical protein